MKILVIGNGGREHALAWKLSQDSCKPQLFCAPGNAGTAQVAVNVPIDAEDIAGLLKWAMDHKPDLTIVGPEAPLCAGLTDQFEAVGLRVFGPSMAAAQIEGSKAFSKDIMVSAGVPTAISSTFGDAQRAIDYIRSIGAPIVVKADGLAAGKGVYVCTTVKDAEKAVQEIMVGRAFGEAGARVVVEECLVGEEASILALVDGNHIVMLSSAQDHKRVFNNDEGPNTGGMGAYSPAPVVTDELWPVIRDEVFGRTLTELRRRGITYKGVLYAGIMLTASGPKVLEFNCRFGDPETEAILPRIAGDLLPALQACIDGTLKPELIQWRPEACVCVIMASGGYPGPYEKGKPILGLSEAGAVSDVVVFHAGTRLANGRVETAGGRVLGVTALGDGLEKAISKAYAAITHLRFDQCQYRSDIGAKALNARRTTR